jgi:hypothetical protein
MKNRSIWRAHLLDTLPDLSHTWSFLTVTADGDDHRAGTTLDAIMREWNKLMMRLKYEWGAFHYVRVYERHKSGAFHGHLLISYQPDDALDTSAWKWVRRRSKSGKWRMVKAYRGTAYDALQRACTALGLGAQVDFTPVVRIKELTPADAYSAVGYVTKYMSKSVGGDMPKGTRRIQTSRAIGSPTPPKADNEWTLKSGIYADDIGLYKWYDVSVGREVTTDDFLDGKWVYPYDAASNHL